MFRTVSYLLKSRPLHTLPRRASVDEALPVSRASPRQAARWRVTQPTVLEGLDAPLPVSLCSSLASPTATAATETANATRPESTEVFNDAATAPLTAQHLWSFSRVLRAHRDARRTHDACVVGGASAIQRIWRKYGIQPTVVYVPETEPSVPAWCLEAALPSVIVRCPPVQVKRSLLSAEYSDGFAAEFPCALQTRLPPVQSLLLSAGDVAASDDGASHARPATTTTKVASMLVLVGLRIPSNVGLLIRAAVDLGFARVVLINCTDPFHEKVLRASDGTVLSPDVTLHELHTADGSEDGEACVALLSAIAAQHHLLPLLAVPSQDAEPAFQVARELSRHNRQCAAEAHRQASTAHGRHATTAPPRVPLGPMLVLGSESQGLRALDGHWSVPYQLVSLPLPNSAVDSFNVGVAGSILLNMFRPGAARHFEKLRDAAGEVDEEGMEHGETLAVLENPEADEVLPIDGEGERHADSPAENH